MRVLFTTDHEIMIGNYEVSLMDGARIDVRFPTPIVEIEDSYSWAIRGISAFISFYAEPLHKFEAFVDPAMA